MPTHMNHVGASSVRDVGAHVVLEPVHDERSHDATSRFARRRSARRLAMIANGSGKHAHR